MKLQDPEVERFRKYWKICDELERLQRQADYEAKRDGKLPSQRKG